MSPLGQLSPEECEYLIATLHKQEGRCLATGVILDCKADSQKETRLSLAKIVKHKPKIGDNIALVCAWAANIINVAGLDKYIEFVQEWHDNKHLRGEPGRCALTGVSMGRDKEQPFGIPFYFFSNLEGCWGDKNLKLFGNHHSIDFCFRVGVRFLKV